MIEKMVNEAIRTNSDIVTCGYCIEYKGLSIPVSPMRKKTMDSLSALRALSHYLKIRGLIITLGENYMRLLVLKMSNFQMRKRDSKIRTQFLKQSITQIAFQ